MSRSRIESLKVWIGIAFASCMCAALTALAGFLLSVSGIHENTVEFDEGFSKGTISIASQTFAVGQSGNPVQISQVMWKRLGTVVYGVPSGYNSIQEIARDYEITDCTTLGLPEDSSAVKTATMYSNPEEIHIRVDQNTVTVCVPHAKALHVLMWAVKGQ